MITPALLRAAQSVLVPFVSPLTGLEISTNAAPGRRFAADATSLCPGLICDGLSGRKNNRSNTRPPPAKPSNTSRRAQDVNPGILHFVTFVAFCSNSSFAFNPSSHRSSKKLGQVGQVPFFVEFGTSRSWPIVTNFVFALSSGRRGRF